MKNYKFLGYVKSTKYNQFDKIYYNPWGEGKFKCIDKDGKERELSKKQQNILYQKFHIRCDWVKIILKCKIGIPIALGFIFTVKYRNILTDVPEITKEYIWDEGILKEERDINKLVEWCQKYIDKNEEFTEVQKEYLKKVWTKYLQDYGKDLKLVSVINLNNNLSSILVDYKSEMDVAGNYDEDSHKITLLSNYNEINSTLFHETYHCYIRNDLSSSMLALEEGFCGAVEKKYSGTNFYVKENEYLLLISEIIGKENLIYYIQNCEEELLYKHLAMVTANDVEDVKSLIELTKIQLIYRRSKEIEKSNELDKEIKETLAAWAIHVDSKNKDNFIILNALQNKYQLDSSFLENKYFYRDTENALDFYTINDENKYDYTYLFDSDYTREKIKNK